MLTVTHSDLKVFDPIPQALRNGKSIFHHSSSQNGEGNGTPLQYSCLESPMDGGAW